MTTVSAYVTNEMYAKYKQVAADNNISVSQVINQAFLNAEVVDVRKIKSLDLQRNEELKRIGNNINQVSRYCNIHKVIDRQVLENLRIIYDDCKNF